jgi:hypothetical protein
MRAVRCKEAVTDVYRDVRDNLDRRVGEFICVGKES